MLPSRNKARRIASESNTIQAHAFVSVGFNLAAFVAKTMHTIGSVFRPSLLHHQFVWAKLVCGITYGYCASIDQY